MTGSQKTTRQRPRGNKGAAATAARKSAFLDAFRTIGIIKHAAEKVGLNRRTVTAWRYKDPAFEIAFIEADQDASDIVRQEIFRRGIVGVKKPLTFKGKKTGDTITEYSDKMLELLARIRGLMPTGDKFGQAVDETTQAQDEEFL